MASQIITRDDARAQGFARYFTGYPCRRGHVAERYVADGKCVACVAKLAAVRSKRWAKRNPEKMRAKTAKWRAANPKAWKESNRASKQRNQERYSAEQKELYAADPEPFKAAWKRYYEANTEYHIARTHKRRARIDANGGDHTAADLREILAVQGHLCAYCAADLKVVRRHVDHILPLARGGSNGRENLQYLCATCNLRKGAKVA